MYSNKDALERMMETGSGRVRARYLQSLVWVEMRKALEALRGDPTNYVHEFTDGEIMEDASLHDFSDAYRTEALMVSFLDEDHDSLDSTAFKIASKFSKYAHETLDEERGGYRIDPRVDYPQTCEAADHWVDSVRSGGGCFIDEAVDGRRYIFISEDTLGFQAALTLMGLRMRFDLRSVKAQIGRHNMDAWMAVDDNMESHLKSEIMQNFKFARHLKGGIKAVPAIFTERMWKLAFETHSSLNQVDSFQEWLERLPTWDGVERLDDWLHQSGLRFNDETNLDLLSWVSKSILLVACHRVLNPGMKHDIMPVLIGDQGLGKSTALSFLFDDKNRQEWFKDELRLADKAQERVESIQGAVIVEVSEMTGATNADIESLKSFLSRQTDFLRLSYRRNPSPMPRRCSIVGTANRSMLPNDPTGNRRFAALFLESGDVEYLRAWLDENREQLWSEAWERARKGDSVVIDRNLLGAQGSQNEMARSADEVLETKALAWLAKKKQYGVDHFTIDEAAEGCGMVQTASMAGQLSVGEGRRLGRVLKTLGCGKTRKSIHGVQQRVWLFPAGMTEDGQEMIEVDEVQI